MTLGLVKDGEKSGSRCNALDHSFGPIPTPDGYLQIVVPISPKKIKQCEERVFLVGESIEKRPTIWGLEYGMLLGPGVALNPKTPIQYVAIVLPIDELTLFFEHDVTMSAVQ